MKPSYKLFFAIPFDSATRDLYERVRATIGEHYPNVTTVIGNKEVGPSQTYSDIATFKAQNSELTKQFVRQIQDADIVIADLTHNNPNVHVELGIALMQNKNIMRVTGRSLTELGFDIRNLEVFLYQNQAQLTERITNYLDMFFKIKQLPISKEFPSLYCEDISTIKLRGLPPKEFDTKVDFLPRCMLRDGAVRVKFEILKAHTPEDWFGLYFRVGDNLFVDSHLVYVRQNGTLAVVVYPGPHLLDETIGQPISGQQTMTVEFENNYLSAEIGQTQLRTEKLSHQAVGRVLPATYRADANVYSLEMICRDTINTAE